MSAGAQLGRCLAFRVLGFSGTPKPTQTVAVESGAHPVCGGLKLDVVPSRAKCYNGLGKGPGLWHDAMGSGCSFCPFSLQAGLSSARRGFGLAMHQECAQKPPRAPRMP